MDIFLRICEIEKLINDFVPIASHDEIAVEVLKEAIAAAKNGTFGIGALLVNKVTGKIQYRGQNRVFTDFYSDLHAEMDLLNSFETIHKSKSRELLQNYILFTSLESCPMCLCRIITAGVPEVYHLAEDPEGGMVHLYENLPPIWRELSKNRIYKKADCSAGLMDIAQEIFHLTYNLNERLR